jgi:hypothetical protein
MITEKISIEIYDTKDIICDCCGKSCCVDEYKDEKGNIIKTFEYMKLEAVWGFFSKKDNTSYKAQICEDCVDEKLSFIKFEIIDENYPDTAMTYEQCLERDRKLAAENKNKISSEEQTKEFNFSNEDAALIGVTSLALMKWTNIFVALFETLEASGNKPEIGQSEIIIGMYKIGIYFENKENIRITIYSNTDDESDTESKELLSFQHTNEDVTLNNISKFLSNN